MTNHEICTTDPDICYFTVPYPLEFTGPMRTGGPLITDGPLISNGPALSNGGMTTTGPLEICGIQFWCCQTITFTTGQINNLSQAPVPSPNSPVQNLKGSTVYLIRPPGGYGLGTAPTTATSAYKITGIIPATQRFDDGCYSLSTTPGGDNISVKPQIIAISNYGGQNVWLPHESNDSQASNRFFFPGKQTFGTSKKEPPGYMLRKNESIILWYDTCSVFTDDEGNVTGAAPGQAGNSGVGRWRQLSYTGKFGPSGNYHGQGDVPDPGGDPGTDNFICEDGTWKIPCFYSSLGAGTNTISSRVSDLTLFDTAPGAYVTLPGTPVPGEPGVDKLPSGYVVWIRNSGGVDTGDVTVQGGGFTSLVPPQWTVGFMADGNGNWVELSNGWTKAVSYTGTLSVAINTQCINGSLVVTLEDLVFTKGVLKKIVGGTGGDP